MVGDEIRRLTHLTMLNLRENKIRELPAGISRLTNLITFDVSSVSKSFGAST